MTETLSPTNLAAIEPDQIPQQDHPGAPRPTSMAIPQSVLGVRSGHLNLDVFSPVNQNGSFEFDRVLKSGEVLKRTKKTKVNPSRNNMFPLMLISLLDSNGKVSFWFFGQIYCQSIKTPPKNVCTNNLISQMLLLSPCSRTQRDEDRMCLDCSRRHETTSYRQRMKRILNRGSNY